MTNIRGSEPAIPQCECDHLGKYSRSNGLTTSCLDMQSLAYATSTSANSRARSSAFSSGSRKAFVGLAKVESTCFRSARIWELCTLSDRPSVWSMDYVSLCKKNTVVFCDSHRALPYPLSGVFGYTDRHVQVDPLPCRTNLSLSPVW